MIIIILVNKESALILNKKYGIKFGENGLKKTNTSHKKYYLTETKNNLRLLAKAEEEILANKK